MKISVIIPAYKEADNLRILLPKIESVLSSIEEFEINIIDTQQPTDDTEQVCSANNVNYIRRIGGNTYGDAIRTGIQSAKHEYTLIMDADGSHSPEAITDLTKEADLFDLTIGSRYIDGGKTDNPAILIFMSMVVNICFRLVLGINVRDISDSFRLYKTNDLKKLQLQCSNFDIVEEILIKLATYNNNYRIREVPITFNKRQFGESKRDLVKFAISYIFTLYKLFRIKQASKYNAR